MTEVDRITPAAGAAARALFDERRRRDRLFGPAADAFGEAGWEMLLLLASVDACHDAIWKDDLVREAGVPTRTAIAWLRHLAARDLVAFAAQDGRPTLALSTRGRALMQDYLSTCSGKQA